MKTWHLVLAGLLAACISVVVRTEFAAAGNFGPNSSVLIGAGVLLMGLVVLTTLPERR